MLFVFENYLIKNKLNLWVIKNILFIYLYMIIGIFYFIVLKGKYL